MEPKRPLFPIYDIMEHWQAFAYATPEVRPVHHALYYALVQMCKRRGGAHRFNLHYQEGMQACGIAARNTYVAALRDLQGWGFVVYTPGANALRAAIVDVKFCACAEQALSMYRASGYTSGDASTEHIIKEVKRLKEEGAKAQQQASDLESKLAEAERLIAELKKGRGLPPPAPCPLTAQAGGRKIPPPPDDAVLFTADTWPALTNPDLFANVCAALGYPEVDAEHYRHRIADDLRQQQAERPAGRLRKTIASWLENDKRDGKLVKIAVSTYNQTATNAQAGVITGSTIPPMSSMLKDPKIN